MRATTRNACAQQHTHCPSCSHRAAQNEVFPNSFSCMFEARTHSEHVERTHTRQRRWRWCGDKLACAACADSRTEAIKWHVCVRVWCCGGPDPQDLAAHARTVPTRKVSNCFGLFRRRSRRSVAAVRRCRLTPSRLLLLLCFCHCCRWGEFSSFVQMNLQLMRSRQRTRARSSPQ